MRVVILGAGITGVTLAYELAARGHAVEVIEQEASAAQQTSFANGGQLSYSHAQPWANPGALLKAVQWMWRDDAPLKFRFNRDPYMIRWGLAFLRNCTQARSDRHTEIMLRLALYSRERLHDILQATHVHCDHGRTGILHIFSSEGALEKAMEQVRFQAQFGCVEHRLSWEECIQKEPALAHADKHFAGGIYAPDDESGDICTFTQNLANYCAEHLGVVFRYNSTVQQLVCKGQSVSHIVTSTGDVQGDVYVNCLGAYSALLMRPLGVYLPIYPMKGYSMTFSAWEDAPITSITDDEEKIVISRLGNRIRAAGTAEFAGYNTALDQKRLHLLEQVVAALFPHVQPQVESRWACIRPQTPDGPPIIGATPLKNLYLNTGHGTLGWTQSAGTATLVADIMEGNTPALPLTGLTLHHRH